MSGFAPFPPLPPPPPPPRAPPPPPPASMTGNPVVMMPPPTSLVFSEEEEKTIQSALLTAGKVLEEARCLESEKEANLLMASSLLGNNNLPKVDVSDLPGGIQDAWAVLSEYSSGLANGAGAVSGVDVINPQTLHQIHDKELTIGQGQLGKATSMATLSACIHRTSQLRNELTRERRAQDGSFLQKSIDTAKRILPGSTDSATESAATANLWLRILDHRLREIRSYHARHSNPAETVVVETLPGSAHKRQRLGNPAADGYDLASSVAESLQGIVEGTTFSSEEVMGKYLDLQPLYETHVVPIKSIFHTTPGATNSTSSGNNTTASFGYADFLTFLSKGDCGLVEGIDEATKLKDRKKYVRFLVGLETYLEGFLKRTQPLLSVDDQVIAGAVKDFQHEWRQTGGCPGWMAKPAESIMVDPPLDDRGNQTVGTKKAPLGIDLSPFASASDLENAVDGDRLKAELTRLGLKCGGTVSDRAKRLFLTKDTPLDQLPKKLFVKATATTTDTTIANDTNTGPAVAHVKNERRVDIAKREVVIIALLNQLKPTLEATIRRTQRRESQTPKEREKELEEDLHGSAIEGPKGKAKEGNNDGDDYSDDDSDDDDAPIYNPKGVPLGWDGKPIPYWLFKLHGLNHFYPCEICGNESYRGRRNFETHFAEAKHSFGMKSLGIPNTKHFHGVTKIDDALKLWNKLKDQLQESQFDGIKDEEYEDSHGNVLSRATYEDLARQGLL